MSLELSIRSDPEEPAHFEDEKPIPGLDEEAGESSAVPDGNGDTR